MVLITLIRKEENMQKILVILATLMLVVGLTGCPATTPISEPVEEELLIPAGMGNVIIEGDFNESKALMDWNDIVEFHKPRIRQLAFVFFPADSGIGKGGGGMEIGSYYHSIDVINGSYSGSILVPAGEYNLYVTAYDELGMETFVYNYSLVVVAGRSGRLGVLLGLSEHYLFQFVVDDLPGDYSEYGYANLVVNGEGYYCQYSRVYPYSGSNEYVVLFRASLPIDFDGRVDESALIVTDLDGKDYATELQFNIFDIDVLRENDYWFMNVPYIFPEWLGRLDVNVYFQEY